MSDLRLKAFDQARAVDHGRAGPEHFLLALLAEPSVATEVLTELGVTYDRLAEYLRNDGHRDRDWPTPRYDPEKVTGPGPACHQIIGSARAFAVAWGHRSPAAEHWLLAMVYLRPGLTVDWLLFHLGTSQQAVVDALRRRGVRVPDVDPPVYRPLRGHRRIEVVEAELGSVLDVLLERHPAGSEWRWGFSWLPGEPRRARVDAEEGIDLEEVLTDARRRAAPGAADEVDPGR